MNEINHLVYEEKRSRFLAYLASVDSEEAFKKDLEELKEKNPKAKHIVYAVRYTNKFGAAVTSFSEDREPISSMKKVKGFLEKDDMRGKAVYIVRYYGGTELGASHLDHVYFTMAMKLLKP